MSGFTVNLFHALDCSDRISVDGIDLESLFTEIAPARRRLETSAEAVVFVDDQDIKIDAGSASFRDAEGGEHTIQFWVEKQLEDFDLIELGEGECGRCGSMPSARDETCPQCTPSLAVRYTADFLAQAWVNNMAVAVDALGDTSWDVTDWIVGLTPDDRQMVLDQEAEPFDFNDVLKGHPNAPGWVREWSGLFEIEVTACGASCACRSGAAAPLAIETGQGVPA